ncbi:MAG: hypothetical protein ACYDAC_12755, partial [Candidatus Dormibacteria bacterium]
RSRLDQQWASVQAESHYGIEPVTQITPFGGGGGGTPGTPGQAGTPGTSGGVAGTNAGSSAQNNPGGLSGPPLVQALERIWDGLKALWRSPIAGLLVLSLLGTLATPLVMAWRRRVLLVALSRSGT